MTFNQEKYDEISSFISKNSKKNAQIVAISKNQPIQSINEALKYGVKIFGENRVQEAFQKFENLKKQNSDIELHLTGPLQTNKVKQALQIFDIFETLDREKLANEFSKHPEIIKQKKFFIQVNIGKEISKSGIYPNEAKEFINYCQEDLNIKIIGLMCIPPQEESPDNFFLLLKKIAIDNNIKKLSMGMSNDYKIAILNDADYIRVGTLIFGKRIK